MAPWILGQKQDSPLCSGSDCSGFPPCAIKGSLAFKIENNLIRNRNFW